MYWLYKLFFAPFYTLFLKGMTQDIHVKKIESPVTFIPLPRCLEAKSPYMCSRIIWALVLCFCTSEVTRESPGFEIALCLLPVCYDTGQLLKKCPIPSEAFGPAVHTCPCGDNYSRSKHSCA